MSEPTDNDQANMALTLDEKVDQRVAQALLRLLSPLGTGEANAELYLTSQRDPNLQQAILNGCLQNVTTNLKNNSVLEITIRDVSSDELKRKLNC